VFGCLFVTKKSKARLLITYGEGNNAARYVYDPATREWVPFDPNPAPSQGIVIRTVNEDGVVLKESRLQ
jgi:hypothetical protein